MKILLLGHSFPHALEKSFYRGFQSHQVDVQLFDLNKLLAQVPCSQNKFVYRLLWKQLAANIQESILEVVDRYQPDLLLVFKGWLVKPATIERLQNRHPSLTICNFNTDNPFNTRHFGNSNNWIRQSISAYDIYFIWGQHLIDPLKEHGATQVEYLPFGYDPGLHDPVDPETDIPDHYCSDVAFIGSWDREREKWLREITDLDLNIWGNAWEKAGREIRRHWMEQPAYGEAFSKVCHGSDIVLNFIREQNRPAHNMRTFEVPACRGCMLSEYTEEAAGFFRPEKEAMYFSSPDELRENIDVLLGRNDLRKRLASASHERLTKGRHSYEHRAERILHEYRALN